MEEQNQVILDAVQELKGADETELKAVIEKWFEETRNSGMRVGARYIAAGVYGIMQKHLKKPSPSLRDYKRMTDDLMKILAVQLKTQQTNSETEE